MDAGSATFLTYGAAILLTSWVLLLVTAWKEDYAWGLCTLFLPPLSYLYALTRLDKAGEAIVVAVVGWVFIFLAI
ncbi:MAG: hypothetical protein P8L70_03520 [Halioglobus sp.]|jgi:hypothetical protein|uniref:Uncharacterized protein n=1 Tax=Candidatus Seongchinamella marina TaxID=2518990 RepID=A0ABT3SZX9_9GAMM|nr:hypothetical protein [Candidatus Seongchinamella marina]EEB76896.1 hypothetical protein GPB2148_200 [marine gamma proteobacterium HTCC2148]MBT3411839.1 hypothetical protein [Halieaceae bacterium]MDG1387269.1 hypothetical protein [Halioglobus sp.]MCX2974834.1 hypothetical protein [Candidatus Seongchinamella marina]MDG2325782.1 hypothetical protein [Halioglobus sp.]